jgi:hypothetical protein
VAARVEMHIKLRVSRRTVLAWVMWRQFTYNAASLTHFNNPATGV